ncbi:tail fiber domain-containing protein, partial [Pseudorhodoplanes sp.]|uniref:tail fiber domain-containing protein n=1 Tax=Pseudorhodoplanes sp. TaxID=1934341 RepID=UPI003D114413
TLDICQGTSWTQLSSDTTTVADNLGNHTATQDLAMGNYKIAYGNATSDKLTLYSNTYGIGIEPSNLTNWSGSAFRWRIGGTSASTGTQYMSLANTGLTVTGSVDASTQFLGQASDTATTPSFSWTGDRNVGMFRPTTDVIGFTTNGSERMRIDSSGQIGIGTSSPSSSLHILKSGSPALSLTDSSRAADLKTWNMVLYQDNLEFQTRSDNYTYLTSAFVLQRDGDVIVPSGNIGIGTTTPSRPIEVSTSTSNEARMRLTSTNTTGGAYSAYEFFCGAAGTTWCGGLTREQSNNDISLWTANSSSTPKMTIKNTGNVGIGTTNPGYTLDISGNLRTTSSVYANIALYTPISVYTGIQDQIRFDGNTDEWWWMSKGAPTGTYAFGVYSPATDGGSNFGFVFYINENGTAWLKSTLTQNSDIRLKEDIRPFNNALDVISKLNGVRFRWKDKTMPGEQIGFIAQDVEKVLPELVATNPEDKMKSVAYTSVIPILTEAVKQLKSENEALNLQLKAANDNQAKILDRLEKLERRLKDVP